MAAFWATYAVAVFAKLSKQYLEALGHIEFEWKRKKSSILRLPDVFWNCREMIATVMHWFSPRIISLLYLSAWMCVCVCEVVDPEMRKRENEWICHFDINGIGVEMRSCSKCLFNTKYCSQLQRLISYKSNFAPNPLSNTILTMNIVVSKSLRVGLSA